MKPAIITISRQFGSGGREISAELSQRIGIPCYEKALFFSGLFLWESAQVRPDFFGTETL